MDETLKLTCRGCGASLEYSAGSRALKCVYCDAVTEIEQEPTDDGVPVDADLVVPLGVTRAALEEVVYAHLAHGDLTPDNLLEHAVFSKVEQFYVPAYFFSGSYEADWTASFGFDRQEHYTVYEKDSNGRSRPVSKTKTVTDWRPVNGSDRGDFAVLAYAGQRLSEAGMKLTEELVERPNIDEFKPYDSSYTSGVAAEPFSYSAQDVYSARASDLVDRKIDAGVRQHAQGDRQKDWRWKASTSKKETSVLLPVCHVVYDYEGRTYNVWTDGTTAEKLIADPTPIDSARQSAIRWGYAPAIVAALACAGLAFAAKEYRLTLNPALMGGATAAALAFGWMRKHSILSYSKNIRQSLLSQRQLKSIDLSMSAADRQAVLDNSARPSRPWLSVTARDSLLLPAITVAAVAAFVAPLAPALLRSASPATSYSAAPPTAAPATRAAPAHSAVVPVVAAAPVAIAAPVVAPAPVPVVASSPAAPLQTERAPSETVFDPVLKQVVAAAVRRQWDDVDGATQVALNAGTGARDRPAARAANAEGKGALQRGDLPAAVEAFARGAVSDPADAEVVNNLAYAYQESGQHEKALGALNQALRLAPRRTSAWANLSASLVEVGEIRAAEASMALALHFSANRQKTLTFLTEQKENGKSEAIRQVASKILAEQDSVPTLGDAMAVARSAEPAPALRSDADARVGGTRPLPTAHASTQQKAEEAYARQMNQQLEQQLRELRQK